jgi:hypothetical protein
MITPSAAKWRLVLPGQAVDLGESEWPAGESRRRNLQLQSVSFAGTSSNWEKIPKYRPKRLILAECRLDSDQVVFVGAQPQAKEEMFC